MWITDGPSNEYWMHMLLLNCTPAIRGLSVLWGVAGCSAHALLPSVDCLYYGVLLAAVPMHSCHPWTVCTMGCCWLQCPCTPAIRGLSVLWGVAGCSAHALLPSVDCLYYGVLLAAVPMHSCHPWTVCTMGCCWLQCPCTPAIRGLSVLWGVAGCSAHALLPSVDCLYYGVLLAAVPMHSCHPWTVCTMGCCWLQCPCTPAICGLSVLYV